MSDYKEAIMERAESLAEDQHGTDFYSLSADQQHRLYEAAMQDYYDRQADRAELMRDAARDNGE